MMGQDHTVATVDATVTFDSNLAAYQVNDSGSAIEIDGSSVDEKADGLSVAVTGSYSHDDPGESFWESIGKGFATGGKAVVNSAANPTPNGLGKATRPIWPKSFNEAMEKALAWLKKRGFDASKAKPYKSRKSPNTNGMKDGNVSYRIEYDNRFGGHINVDAGKEKGPHFIFPGNKKSVETIKRQLFNCN